MEQRGSMTDVSLTTAGLKTAGGGGLILAWFESNMNLMIGMLTILYLAFQILVIFPKVVSEAKRHWFSFVGLFDRREIP